MVAAIKHCSPHDIRGPARSGAARFPRGPFPSRCGRRESLRALRFFRGFVGPPWAAAPTRTIRARSRAVIQAAPRWSRGGAWAGGIGEPSASRAGPPRAAQTERVGAPKTNRRDTVDGSAWLFLSHSCYPPPLALVSRRSKSVSQAAGSICFSARERLRRPSPRRGRRVTRTRRAGPRAKIRAVRREGSRWRLGRGESSSSARRR